MPDYYVKNHFWDGATWYIIVRVESDGSEHWLWHGTSFTAALRFRKMLAGGEIGDVDSLRWRPAGVLPMRAGDLHAR